jgi:hypothetical protein
MPKTFSQEERTLAMQWSDDGLTYAEIAKRLSNDFPDNWKDLKSPERAIGRLLKQAREQKASVVDPLKSNSKVPEKTLDEMTREERHVFISHKLQSTPRFRLTFRNFGDDEKDLFMEEYLSVIKSTDTITEAEEQALFAAVLELVLALQALSRKEQQESWYEQTKNAAFDEEDSRYTPHLGGAEKYAKEYDNHMKLYQKGMEQNKMARHQRLKQSNTERKSLVDLAEELSSKNARSTAADDIEKLSKLRDEELKDMIANGYILGKFEE